MNQRLLRCSFVVLLMLLGSIALFAQQRTVTGTILNQETREPLAGVTVSIKGSDRNTITNDKGIFTIPVPSNETVLKFTFIGFTYQEMRIGARTSVSISLSKENKVMDEVVVVGYGTKKRVNVLGAVSTIKAEDIEDIPVANLGSALVSRIPGVGVNFASGKPGSPTTINIRNATTFSGASAAGVGVTSDPLFVIDGLIVTKQDFDNLDATLVDNISFLKDASAAIYGAAGAKGVVLVTTKRGKAGKPKISYSGYFGNSDAAVKPKILSAYEHAKMLNDGYVLNNSPLTSRFSQADLDFLATNPYKSWYDETWHSSNLQRHTVNVSGGTERVTFFAGGNYYNETGNYGGISLNKYGIRSGMNAKVTDEITADISLNTDYAKDMRHTLKGASDETDDLMIRTLFLTPQWVPLTIDGKPVNYAGINPPGAWNPVGLENSGNYKWQKSQGINLNASIVYRPNFLKGLAAKFQFGTNSRNSNHKEYFPPYKVYNFTRTGQNSLLYTTTPTSSPTSNVANSDQLGESTTLAKSYQMIASLQYTKKFSANQDFDIMVAMDQGESESENVFFYKNGQLISGIDQFWAFNTASSVIRNPTYTEGAKRSFLGRMNYTLSNKYFLEVIARYDASSNFAPENRWGLFPSVGLGWKISDESFFKDNIHFIDFMKFRANVGLVGEDRVTARLWDSRFTQTPGALIGSTANNGLDPNIYPNRDITWEKARHINVGMDVTLLRNKLTVGVDFYNRYTYDGYDKLENGALPATAGINTAVVNYGKQLNWGSEFSVGYRDNINKDWKFNADVNFGWSNSNLMQAYYNANTLGLYNEYEIAIGQNPKKYNGSNYGYIAKGILRTQAEVDALLAKNPNYKIGGAKPQVGFMDFEDKNGDGMIDDKDIVPMFENTSSVIGFGITLGVSYKQFRLNTNLNLAIGGKKFFDSEARKVPTTLINAPAFWADHWTPENPDAKYPRADAPLAKENSTFWAVDGTQSRINNLSLSYALPKKLSERYRIPEFRAMITATNLLNIVNPFKYKDPYNSNFAQYPTLRTISLGLNVSL